MRQIQNYILRLLIDPAEPDALRGALRPMPEGETRSFSSAQALLALLRDEALRAPADGATGKGKPMDQEGIGK